MAVYPVADLMGSNKSEVDVQSEREKDVLAVTYFDESDIPPSPYEPASLLQEVTLSDDSMQVKKMKLGYSLEGDTEVTEAIAALHGTVDAIKTTQPPPVAIALSTSTASQSQTQQLPQPIVQQTQPVTPHPMPFQANHQEAPPSGNPQDLNALLAKLADPAAVAPVPPMIPVPALQSYGYPQQIVSRGDSSLVRPGN